MKSLRAHKNPHAELKPLLKELLQDKVTEIKQERERPSKFKNAAAETPGKRVNIPQNIKSELFKRANHQCEIPKCGSNFKLEIDHIVPIHQMGTTAPNNLRVVCRNHNLLHSF